MYLEKPFPGTNIYEGDGPINWNYLKNYGESITPII